MKRSASIVSILKSNLISKFKFAENLLRESEEIYLPSHPTTYSIYLSAEKNCRVFLGNYVPEEVLLQICQYLCNDYLFGLLSVCFQVFSLYFLESQSPVEEIR
jgi:hypothetical protein